MRIIGHLVVIALMILGLSAGAQAGSSTSSEGREDHRAQGYAFFAPGAIVGDGYSLGTAHFGAGGEGLLYKGLGLGAEVGYITPWRNFKDGIGMLSVNGSYHFNRNGKLSPFVSGGYSMAFRSGHVNLFNFGGGVNYWWHDRIGLRVEFRDHVYSEFSRATHFLGGRIGFSFR